MNDGLPFDTAIVPPEEDPLPADPVRLLAAVGKWLRQVSNDVHDVGEVRRRAKHYADEVQSSLRAYHRARDAG